MRALIAFCMTVALASPAAADNLCYHVLFDNGERQNYRVPPFDMSGSISQSLKQWRPGKGLRPVHLVIAPNSECRAATGALASETVSRFAPMAAGPRF